jgi:hypothetical protein
MNKGLTESPHLFLVQKIAVAQEPRVNRGESLAGARFRPNQSSLKWPHFPGLARRLWASATMSCSPGLRMSAW